MTNNIRATFGALFQDLKNYPYGFSRSGDFSIKESQVLESNGRKMAAFADGLVQPQDNEETRLVQVIRGEVPAETLLERVWMKYQNRINRPHVSALSSKSVSTDSDVDDSVTIDDDEDLT
ncbi:DUF413 domain-containing protein [Echinimonas agarilytica]|uniref:Macrodomain Ori protein n=1 Tax=Echinimonas agarilytica TaxID=1215918 RepID=A0AA41W482_9GAMM|nr:DUF413 domain-containing protein [Echinimonas agarilytica]MCM2678455.1 DUF413 domain-containing protein [Echinimonas agarilytica]